MAWHSRFLYNIVVYSVRLYFHHQTSTTGCRLCFGSASSFLLELFLHSSPVAYWTPASPGGSSFSVTSFCLFVLFMGFSGQECWSGLSPPSPVDLVLSYLSAITQLSCVVLYGMVQSFIELYKATILVGASILSALWWMGVHASWWEGLAVGKTRSCSGGQGRAQYIFNPVFWWWVGLCSLPVVWTEVAQSLSLHSYGGAIGSMVGVVATFSTRTYASTLRLPGLLLSIPLTLWQATVDLCLCRRLPYTHRQVWLSLLWGHCSFLLGPGAHMVLPFPSKSLFPQCCGSFIIKSHWHSKSHPLGIPSPFARSPGLEVCCGPLNFHNSMRTSLV